MIWLQHGMGLTQEGNRALPYLKRGRGNLCDKRIYFSTGLFASSAGRKWLLEFRQPAALLGRQREGPRRPGAGRRVSGRAASSQPPAQPLERGPSERGPLEPLERGPCWGQENWPLGCGSFTLAGRPSPCAGKGHHPVTWEWAGFFEYHNFQSWI